MAFAHGMSSRINSYSPSPSSNGSFSTGTYTPTSNYDFTQEYAKYMEWSARYKGKEEKDRAKLIDKKEKGEQYLRINCEEVVPTTGAYKTFWPYSDDGIMTVFFKNGVIESVVIKGETFSLNYFTKKLERIKATEAQIKDAETKLTGMDEIAIQALVENKSKNEVEKEFFVIPTTFWQCIDPGLIAERYKIAMSILNDPRRGYYKTSQSGFVVGSRYYRFCPLAKDGIGALWFKTIYSKDKKRFSFFDQTYKDENDKIVQGGVMVLDEPIWTRMGISTLFGKSASKGAGRRKRTKKR